MPPKGNIFQKKKFTTKKLSKHSMEIDNKRPTVKKRSLEEMNGSSDQKPTVMKKGKFITKKEKRKIKKQELAENIDEIFKQRVRDMEPEKRKELCEKEMKVVRGKIKELLFQVEFKKQSSRIIQLILKHGTEKHREEIYNEVKGSLFDFTQKFQHGHHFLMKMLKYTKSKRDDIIQELYGKYTILLQQKDCCKIVDYIYTELAKAKHKTDIILEFYSQEYILFKPQEKLTLDDILQKQPQRKQMILENLRKHITDCVNKGAPVINCHVLHHLMWQYISHAPVSEIISFSDLIREQVVDIVHTWDGSRVAFQAINHGGAKDRKIIIKSMKGYVPKVCLDNYGHIVIIRLLEATDDTSIIKKSILTPIIEAMDELASDKWGVMVFLHLLTGRSTKYFSPEVVSLLNTPLTETSKKDPESKRKELLDYVIPSLVTFCEGNAEKLLRSEDSIHLYYEVIKQSDNEDKQRLFVKICELVQQDENNIMEIPLTSRVLKKLIHEETQEGSVFATQLANSIDEKWKWAPKKGAAWVILALLEAEVTREKVSKELLPHLKILSKEDGPGCKLIVQNLTAKTQKRDDAKNKKTAKPT